MLVLAITSYSPTKFRKTFANMNYIGTTIKVIFSCLEELGLSIRVRGFGTSFSTWRNFSGCGMMRLIMHRKTRWLRTSTHHDFLEWTQHRLSVFELGLTSWLVFQIHIDRCTTGSIQILLWVDEKDCNVLINLGCYESNAPQIRY